MRLWSPCLYTCFEDVLLHQSSCQYIKSSQYTAIPPVHSLLLQSLQRMDQFWNWKIFLLRRIRFYFNMSTTRVDITVSCRQITSVTLHLRRYVFMLLPCVQCRPASFQCISYCLWEQHLSTYVTIHARTNRTYMSSRWLQTRNIKRHDSSQYASSNITHVACESMNKKSPVTSLFP